MGEKNTFIGAAIIVLGIAGAASLAWAQGGYQGGDVQPCSLAGINPSDHPGIFGNPEVARRQYGFVRGPDGNWQVIPDCENQIER